MSCFYSTISVAGCIALAHTRERARTGRDSRDDPTASGQDSRPPGSGQRTAGRVRALMGDLTALHDLTGLIIGPDEQTPELVLVVVDDAGGGMFAWLEHAAAPPELLRRFFTTPHGTDRAAAAAALGASARTVDVDGLPAALATPATGLRMIVVQEGPSPLSPSSWTSVVP